MKNKSVAIIDYVGIKGGNHYYSLCLLDALAKLGYETYLLSNFNKGLNKEDIRIQAVYKTQISRNLSGIANLIFGSLKACRILKRKKVKTVIFHLFEASSISLMTLFIFKLFGLHVIGISHDITSFSKDEKQRVRDFIYTRLLNQVIVHNQFSYNCLKAVMPIEVLSKTKIIKHGGHRDLIDTSITKQEARQSLQLNQAINYALFFGQIKDVKGLDLLLEAFPNDLPNLHLIIAGKPWKSDFKKYQEIIDRRNLAAQVHLKIEYISEADRDLLYNAADFIILPYREIFQSGVLLMSMSYGLPILVSNLEANRELIKVGEGLLFESENKISLEQKIREMEANPELRKKFAQNALLKIKSEYDWNNIAKEYLSIIK